MSDIWLTVDWYTTNSWTIYHWHLTNIRPTVDRLPLRYDRYSIKMRPRNINWCLADSLLQYWLTIDQLLADYQPSDNQLSTKYQLIQVYQWTIDQLSADILIKTTGTYSKHDHESVVSESDSQMIYTCIIYFPLLVSHLNPCCIVKGIGKMSIYFTCN